MGLFNPTPGSWSVFGRKLPDFGISEALAAGIGAGTTPEGGSDIFPNQPSTDSTFSSYNDPSSFQTYNQPSPTSGPTGDVLGTQAPIAPADTTYTEPTGGGISPEEQARIDAENAMRGQINTGWDQYMAGLDAMLNEGLTGQKTAQEGIARSSYDTGIKNLGIQKAEGEQLLGRQREKTQKNQKRTLRDLSSNLRNMFMAGNVLLGARGAGDSSAANQYAYALTKMGSRQRSDIMGQSADIQTEIDDREFKLGNIFNTEKNNLEQQMNERIGQVADWFNAAQNQIRQAQAEGGLGRSQDLSALSQQILNQATQALQTVQQESQNQKSALEQWALQNSENITQLRANMQNIQGFDPRQPKAQPIAGQPRWDAQNNLSVPAGYGGGSSDDDLFQRSAWFK